MTLLKDNNYKDINVALLSLEADIKNKTGFDTSVIDRQLAEINNRIDKINAGNNNSSAEINDIRTEIENINSKLNAHSVRIESIEQKLSDIFSAENKVTDFNTTTDSGIYYWITDAANKPGTDCGVLLVNKYDDGQNNSIWVNQIAYGTNNKIYFRQNINSGNWTEWKAVAFEGSMKANFLDEYPGAGGTRPTSGNIAPKDASEYGGMRKDIVSDSMTDSGRPGQDGHLLTMFWDNSGRYDTQFYISNDGNRPWVKVRYKTNETDYGPWVDVITSNNIGSQTVAKAGTADVANALAYRGGIENTDTFQNVMNNDGKWRITDLSSGWNGSLYVFHAGGSQSGLMFRIRGGSSDIRNVEVNYSIDSRGFAGPWQPLIGRIPTSAPSSPQDGDIWIS